MRKRKDIDAKKVYEDANIDDLKEIIVGMRNEINSLKEALRLKKNDEYYCMVLDDDELSMRDICGQSIITAFDTTYGAIDFTLISDKNGLDLVRISGLKREKNADNENEEVPFITLHISELHEILSVVMSVNRWLMDEELERIKVKEVEVKNNEE